MANPLGHPPLCILLAQFGHIPQAPSSSFLAIKHWSVLVCYRGCKFNRLMYDSLLVPFLSFLLFLCTEKSHLLYIQSLKVLPYSLPVLGALFFFCLFVFVFFFFFFSFFFFWRSAMGEQQIKRKFHLRKQYSIKIIAGRPRALCLLEQREEEIFYFWYVNTLCAQTYQSLSQLTNRLHSF